MWGLIHFKIYTSNFTSFNLRPVKSYHVFYCCVEQVCKDLGLPCEKEVHLLVMNVHL